MSLGGYTSLRVLDILDSLGYAPITSHASSLLYTSIKKALERNMEKQFVPILIEKLCSIAKLTDNELLTNYDLFENSLFKLFDSRRFLEIVLHWVKIEMLTESVLQDSNITVDQILDPRLTINDILLHISSEQVHRFIQNLPAHKHIAYCYQSKQSKDKALTAFFNPTVINVNDEGSLRSLIKSHSHVIVDYPYMIYAAGGEANVN